MDGHNKYILVLILLGITLQFPLHASATPTLLTTDGLTPAQGKSILFIGNSFTYGAASPVENFHVNSITDLNGEKKGGVPALFRCFIGQSGFEFDVYAETAPGKGLDYHFANKKPVISRPWDVVVMHGLSVLDKDKPGDPTLLIQSTKQVSELLHDKNPEVDIRLVATWARADQLHTNSGPWSGKSIAAMTRDIRAGYNSAKSGTPLVHQVIPVGDAWNRAMTTELADPNPYDGIAPGQINLWAGDNYHASSPGYYLSALMIFGAVTGLDPRSLGDQELAAVELGFPPGQARALQQVAYDELAASGVPLKPFKPVTSSR